MRVHLDIENARLRRALTDLLEDAGHVVDTSPRSEAVGLRIVSAPGAGGAGHKVPTLYLRPGRGFPAAKDPGDALQAALRSGGAATWSPPLDAELLVACLGEAASGTRAASALQAAPPLHSPEPWFVIDPRTMEVWWASEAARVRFLVPGRSRLSERGAAAVPSTALHTENGGEVRTVEGRPHFVLWWTDDHGRRVVGLLHLPAGSSTTPGDANVSTLAELGRVSATLAHEIRNPLASFAGALDLLGRAGDPDERASVLRLARTRLDRMRTMLDDALRLARPFGGSPQPVAAADIVRSVIAAVRTDTLFDKVELRVEAGAAPKDVVAHPDPLRQAVMNLLVNAAQAQGGRGRITVRIEAGERCGLIRVEDDGPGIPASVREKVFAPFWTTKEGGTGLGLAYVRRVAEAAGGRALVENAPRGACVRLELPFAEAR